MCEGSILHITIVEYYWLEVSPYNINDVFWRKQGTDSWEQGGIKLS